MDTIKFSRLDRLYQRHTKEILEIVDNVYSTGQVLKDKQVKALEERIASMCNRKYAVALGSCTDALYQAVYATGLSGKTIAVNDLTFEASKSCIRRAHGRKIEIVPDKNYQLDIASLKSLLKSEVIEGLICVNLFGQMGDMEEITNLCNDFNITLIEDAAQSFTSSWKGKPAGSFGDVSCLSFDPMKILPAFATGGMLLTDNKEIADSARKNSYRVYGTNSQLSTLQAALLLYFIDFLPVWERELKEIAKEYKKGLQGIVDLPQEEPNSNHIWHKFVIETDDRDNLMKYLAENGIEAKVHYEPYKRVLSLPIYPWLHNSEVDYIIDKIKEFCS